MAGKKKKREKKNGEKKKKSKKPGLARKEGKSRSKCQIDVFNEAAMDNAYYTCHNVQDLLKSRGFPWPELQKKKKKKKK
nr:small lysine-rich protein 1 [Halyomorpha halys]